MNLLPNIHTNFNIKGTDEQLIKKVTKHINREDERTRNREKTQAEKMAQEALSQAKTALVKTLDSQKNRMNIGFETYDKLYIAVAKEIGQLRVILGMLLLIIILVSCCLVYFYRGSCSTRKRTSVGEKPNTWRA
jgi:hypothetical protein